MWTDARYWIFNISQIFTFFAASGPLVYLFSRAALDLKIDPMDSAYVVSVMGIFNTIGRLVFGAMGNLLPGFRLYILAFSIATFGGATVIAVWGYSWIAISIFAAVFGATYGKNVCFSVCDHFRSLFHEVIFRFDVCTNQRRSG